MSSVWCENVYVSLHICTYLISNIIIVLKILCLWFNSSCTIQYMHTIYFCGWSFCNVKHLWSNNPVRSTGHNASFFLKDREREKMEDDKYLLSSLIKCCIQSHLTSKGESFIHSKGERFSHVRIPAKETHSQKTTQHHSSSGGL